MIINGMVVQGPAAAKYANRPDYIGVASRVSWPLRWLEDAVSVDLTKELKSWFPRVVDRRDGQSYLPWVCPDPEFVRRYVEACDVNGIGVRILLCVSERFVGGSDSAVLRDLQSRATPIGWEYALAAMAYSVFVGDLSSPVSSRFSAFQSRSSTFGVYRNLRGAVAHVWERDRILEADPGYLEHDLDWFYACFSEIDRADPCFSTSRRG